MSAGEAPPRNPGLQNYLKAWGDGICRVIQEIAGAPHSWKEMSAEAAETMLPEPKENSVYVQFEASEGLSGHQAFVLSNQDAVRLAQMLLMEAQDGSTQMDDDRRDALGELFRQFSGAAASALKTVAGEVGFRWIGLDPLPGEPSFRLGLEWMSEGLSPLSLLLHLDKSLVEALSSLPAQAVEPAPPSSQPRSTELPSDPKLELLMGVELDVSLRFGEREMALRDILELSAGSVVELNQRVQDPVELLIGDKVVARGEVVVVDGSYALRVIQIASPQERIESLRG